MKCQCQSSLYICGHYSPQSDAQAPNSFGLKAVHPRASSPRPKPQRRATFVHVACQTLSESCSALRIAFCRSVGDVDTVQKAEWLAKYDRYDDESQEQEGVDAGHNQEAEVRLGVEEGDTDQTVQRCNRGLDTF